MKLTPLQKRAARRDRHGSMVDMNLVSLIDVFTILIFFLLSSASGVEVLTTPKAVTLPESSATKAPRETLVVTVNASEILVAGRKVASVADAMGDASDVIGPLKAALDAQASQGKAVTIMGDKDIPFQLLRKVMASAARANFTDVSFAVRQRI